MTPRGANTSEATIPQAERRLPSRLRESAHPFCRFLIELAETSGPAWHTRAGAALEHPCHDNRNCVSQQRPWSCSPSSQSVVPHPFLLLVPHRARHQWVVPPTCSRRPKAWSGRSTSRTALVWCSGAPTTGATGGSFCPSWRRKSVSAWWRATSSALRTRGLLARNRPAPRASTGPPTADGIGTYLTCR